MTDEKRLHGMMADAGPAPSHDANGFPADERRDPFDNRPGDWAVHDEFDRLVVVPGHTEEAARKHIADWGRGTLMRLAVDGRTWYPAEGPYARPDLMPETQNSAGPASSSASTGGTGGLAEVDALLARLEAATAALTTYSQMLREELEGQRRELWDALVAAARIAEIGGRPAAQLVGSPTGYARGLEYAYHLVTGIDGEELERLLAAELDSRYGKDRAKGGGPS